MPNGLKPSGVCDHIAAGELVLYAENEREIYFRHYRPVALNLQKHFKRGEFDLERATDALERYWVTPAAKRFHLQHCDRQQRWFQVFDKPTRREAAAMEAKGLLTEFELGNFFGEAD